MSWPWSELGLPGPADMEAVKHAYAQRLKTTHPEEDPEGFQRLHEAYQAARRLARQQARRSPAPAPEAEALGPEEAPESAEEEESSEVPGDSEGPEEGFDYERLFAEGEQERLEALRRRAEDRLRAARQRRGPDVTLDQEEVLNAVRAALCALEVSYASGASEREWVLFLHGSAFLDVQHNADFLFGLEDFLREHAELPEDIRRKIFLAYGFYQGRPSPLHQSLYRLLLPSYQGAGAAELKRRVRRDKGRKAAPFLVVLGLLLLAFGLSVGDLFAGPSDRTGSARTGSADSSGAFYAPDYSDVLLRSTLEVPDTHDREGEIDNDVPLEGGHKTSFFGIVVTYAAADYPGLYATSGRGTAENSQETFQWMQITGQDEHMEELVMNYYLSADKKTFYMIPEGHEGETVDVVRCKAWGGIGFYKYAG